MDVAVDLPVWRIERYGYGLGADERAWHPSDIGNPSWPEKWRHGPYTYPLMTFARASQSFVAAKKRWPGVAHDAHLYRLFNTKTKDVVMCAILL